MLVYREILIATAAAMFQGAKGFYMAQSATTPDPTACPDPVVDNNGNAIVPEQVVKCGDTVTDNTSGGSNGTNLDFCATGATTTGLWYRFEDYVTPHDTVTFSTCNQADFDTKIIIFNGIICDLGRPTCLAGRDDNIGVCSGLTTMLSISAPGIAYVYVTGFSSFAGTFTLSVTCN